MSSINVTLDEFLKRHSIRHENPKPITNTRIGDKSMGIFGGSYHIPDDEYNQFLEIYYKHTIQNGNPEYLTEKQKEDGPIVVDLDFRYDYAIQTRQHSEDHILDLISIYLVELAKIYAFQDKTRVEIFVFEKPAVNRVENKNITKDGIHMIIGLHSDRATQIYLRSKVMDKIADAWSDLPLKNSWDEVIDEGIVAGYTNWQLFGSRKPNNQTYDLTYARAYEFNEKDQDFELSLQKIDIHAKQSLMPRLSVRYTDFPRLSFTSSYEKTRTAGSGSAAAGAGADTLTPRRKANALLYQTIAYNATLLEIKNQNELNSTVDEFLDSLTPTDYELREAHNYTMILPESYYGENSYNKWIRVGWSLRNISDRLFVTWVAFSAQSKQFKFSDITDLYERWQKFDLKNPEGLTKRSIIYWAKQDAKAKFEQVHKESIHYYVDQTLNTMILTTDLDSKLSGSTDYDLACVLYQMFKDEYVCVSVKNSVWYRYKDHRWAEIDSGTYLRQCISKDMREIYRTKSAELFDKLSELEETSEAHKKLNMRISKINEICARLGKTKDKQNIMTEAKELFYDADFLQKLDTNPYLLCFNNGVVDFKINQFRKGYPEDYISKTTNIDYVTLDPQRDAANIAIANDFMNKLFPVPELREYMWQHLASTLIGTSSNQTFNMYLGMGQNGKSVLVNLMESILGTYKGDVPLTLITNQRAKVGGLTPELVALKGVRYAVMQEPSKGDKINEGIMKQITSGIDPIQCRAPYMVNILTYIPQFKLVVCTNELMEIKSNDHGTWRRIRVCDFMSLFTENPVQGDPEKPYQYKIDKNIIESFKTWKHTFMAMLVEKAFQTGGIVADCSIVMASSNEYRNNQDYVAEFVDDRLIKCESSKLQKRELAEEFRLWYISAYGRNVPNLKEVTTYINKHFSKYDKIMQCWHGIKVRYESGAGAAIGGGAEDDIDDGNTEGATEISTVEEYGL